MPKKKPKQESVQDVLTRAEARNGNFTNEELNATVGDLLGAAQNEITQLSATPVKTKTGRG